MRPRRPRILLRDPADIDRLCVHLVTHWHLPLVDVRIDQLPVVHSHRAQDRFARLSEACNCMLGEALAGVTLLIGSCLACIGQEWRHLWWTLVATLAAFLAGKIAEVAWNRVKLLLSLRLLRTQVADAIAGRFMEPPTAAVPERRTYDYPLNSREADLPESGWSLQSPARSAGRPKIVVREVVDIDRLIHHLATHRRLPRVVIQIEGMDPPVLERAQDRLVRLSSGNSYQLAGLLGFATFVLGMTYVMRPPEDAALWTMNGDWSDFLLVLLVTFMATLSGCVGEILWNRMQLFRVLRRLRRSLSES